MRPLGTTQPGTMQRPVTTPTREKHQVVVGLDGSSGSRAALSWAVREARRRGSTVHAVLVWQHRESYPGNIGSLGLVPAFGLDQAADASAKVRQIVDEVVREDRSGGCPDVLVTSAAVEGVPAAALVEASDGADLLVLGKKQHNGLRNALLGSLGQRVLDHAVCAVVVVPNPSTPPAE